MKDRKMKLGLFVPMLSRDYNKIPASAWIRLYQMVPYYQSLGIEVHVNNPFHSYDAAIYFRIADRKSYYFIRFLKGISRRVYFDTCVNYFELHEHTDRDTVRYMHKISGIVDGIICSTDNICGHARQYNDNVFVMDDPVDTKHFRYVRSSPNLDDPLFGWSGISVKAHFLNEYARQIDNRVLLVTDRRIFEQDLDFRYQYVQWQYDTFPLSISQVDVALLNRTYDTVYDQGHSSFKALVFAVQGVPIVASKVPSYLKLAGYYEGIVFLEDFGQDLVAALDALKGRNYDPTTARRFYSCENQVRRVVNWMGLTT